MGSEDMGWVILGKSLTLTGPQCPPWPCTCFRGMAMSTGPARVLEGQVGPLTVCPKHSAHDITMPSLPCGMIFCLLHHRSSHQLHHLLHGVLNEVLFFQIYYLLFFGYAGSSLLCGFSLGLLSSHAAQAPHCRSVPC